MIRAAALLLLALPAGAAAPSFAPEAPLKALKAAGTASLQGVDELLGVPVEPARAPALKAAIGKVAGEGAAAAAAASSLHDLTGPPAEAMEAAAKGRGGVRAVEARAETAREGLAALKARWDRLDQAAREVKEKLPPKPGAEPEDPETAARKKEKRAELIKKLREVLDAAARGIEEASAGADALRASASAVRQEARRAAAAQDDLARAASALAGQAASLRDAAAEAAAAVDALGGLPLADSRGRAYRKLEPVSDGGRVLFRLADAAANRAGTFTERWNAFAKALPRYEDSEKALGEKTKAIEILLDAAEKLLAELKP